MIKVLLTPIIDAAEVNNGKGLFDNLAPGRYRVYLGKKTKDAVVEQGKDTIITVK